MTNKKKITDYLIYLVPGLIVCLIMLSIFFVKQLYPFSNVAALQIDADYNYVPTLFKFYDIFHFGDSLLWDFKLGGGANIYGSLVMNSVYSPLNWFVVFSSRNNVANFFNILLIIKFSLMATTMFIFVHKNFNKANIFWQILLSVLYVLSGWRFLMYSNIFYIDIVILFPIIMYYLFKFFKEGKSLGLTLLLSYCVILNVYLSYMVYLFVIFGSLIVLLLFYNKQERRERIVKLSIAFAFPLFISAFASWPTVVQIFNSIRGGSTRRDGYFYYFFLKFLNLSMSALLVALFSKNFKKGMFKDRKNLLIIILFILTTIGVVIEPINCMWHTGSYNAFPYRYSFMSIFIMICGCLNYLSNNEFIEKTYIKYRYAFFVIFLCECLIIVFLNMFNSSIKMETLAYDIFRPGVFLTLAIIFALLFIIYRYIFKLRSIFLQKGLIVFFALFEIFLYSGWCFDNLSSIQSTTAISYIEQFDFGKKDVGLYKYIAYQSQLGVNSSYITRVSTISNWLHIIPQKQHDFVENLGYAYSNSLIYGYGGTIFTDSLVGVKYFYSQLELPDDIFNLITKFDSEGKIVYVYEFKYPMSFGIKYFNDSDLKELNSAFDEQNYYCRKFLNFDGDIVKTGDLNIKDDKNNFKFSINEPVILYFEITDDLLKGDFEKITVDGEEVSFGNSKKIVYLGEYKKNFSIEVDKRIDEESEEKDEETYILKYGYIKVSDYKKITKKIQNEYNVFDFKGNKLHINIDGESGQSLFLPINNINGWSAKVNGKKVSIDDELYTFMSIKLDDGNNDIEMEFYPPLFKESIIVSIFSVLLLCIYCIFEKKIIGNRVVQFIVVPVFYFISLGLFVYIYIISNFVY